MADLPYSLSRSPADLPNFAQTLEESERALSGLLAARPRLELIDIVERSDDLAEARQLAHRLLERTSTIFVLGIGGSSLGGQALKDLASPLSAARVRFFDNPDPFTYERALAGCDLKSTRFIAISKSGGTPETLAQTLIAADALKRAGGENYLAQHFAVVTEPKPSPLRGFAEYIGCPVLDHPPGIGGRYSVLSVVGLLPALLMGLNAEAVRGGAALTLKAATARGSAAALGATQHAALYRAGKIRESVLFCYSDRLKTFGAWWRQLWAESLGKNGKGTTPVAALGPVDQHSQLQLFLDGPGDAFFTLIDCATRGQGPTMPEGEAKRLKLDYLAGRR